MQIVGDEQNIDFSAWCRNLQAKIFDMTDVWKQKDNLEKIISLMSIDDSYIGATTDPEIPKTVLEDLFGVYRVDAKMTWVTIDQSELKSLCFYHPNSDYSNSVVITLDPKRYKFMVSINYGMMKENDKKTKTFDPHD